MTGTQQEELYSQEPIRGRSVQQKKHACNKHAHMQKNFHIGKFFGRVRRRSLRLAITTRKIGVERSFLLWAPDTAKPVSTFSSAFLDHLSPHVNHRNK